MTLFVTQGDATVDTRWWKSFDSEPLSALVTRALTDNLTLNAYQLRAKSSSISAKIAQADLYPQVNLNASANSNYDDLNDINSSSFGLAASWELDVWGRISASADKAYWDNQGQQALYRARANLVAGSISSAWFLLISELEKQRVLASQYQRTSDALQLIKRRFALGKNSVTNIWQQEKLLKSIAVQQAKNIASIYIYRQTVALWLGIPEHKLPVTSTESLPTLPALPKLGIPAEVLKYRPDVEQAFAKIKAANESLAISIAEQYPRLTLRSTYLTHGSNSTDLFDDWTGNLIASLTSPIYDHGTKKAVVEQRRLLLEALIYDYQQVWLDAVSKVNQALVNESQLLEVEDNLRLQLDLARKTERLTALKYLNGKTNYLNLLRAQESILGLEIQFINAQTNIMTNRVFLYREFSQGDFAQNDSGNQHNNQLSEN